MRLLVACPVVQAPGLVPGWRTWDRPVLVIDNTERAAWLRPCSEQRWPYLTVGTNIGVAASWNLAAAYAREHGYHYLALISSSVVWHSGLGQLDRLLDFADPDRGLLTELAFHATVWALPLLDRLGRFDENFWPGYYEDNDWVRRLDCAGEHTGANPIPKVEIDATSEPAQSLLSGAIRQPDFGLLGRYYAHKWGGMPGNETWCQPFGLPVPLWWWPVLHGLPRWAARPLAIAPRSAGHSDLHRTERNADGLGPGSSSG